MTNPLVSVIVTTKNSAKTLKECLKSVKKQSYKQIELIVVDNHSTDKTKQIAQKFTNKFIIAGNERSSQRNIGARQSRGKYLLFLDSDMCLTKNVVKECVLTCKEKDISGIYIPELILGNSFFAKVRNFERQFYNATVIDAVRFVPKNIFDKIAGFDELLYAGEDWDFDKRVRMIGNTETIQSSLLHDETYSNFRSYMAKKSYYAAGLNAFEKKWRGDKELKKQLGFGYRYVLVFIENGKWKRLLRHPFLSCGMMIGKIIIGLTYLNKKNK